jgi:hypothetical protein
LDEDAAIEAASEISLQAIGISAAILFIGGACVYRSWKKRAATMRNDIEPEDTSQISATGVPYVPGAVVAGDSQAGLVAEPRFTNSDFDEVVFRLEISEVNMYVNGGLEIRGLTGISDVAIDALSRTYLVQARGGTFRPQEDLVELQKQVDLLFSAHAAALAAPAAGQGGIARSMSRAEVITEASGQMAQQNPQKVNMVRMLLPVVYFSALGYGFYKIVIEGSEFYYTYATFMGACALISMMAIVIGNIIFRMGRMRWNTCDVTAADNPILVMHRALRQFLLMIPFIGLLGIAWGVYRLASPGSMYYDDCAGLTR